MSQKILSVVVPCFNEAATLDKSIARLVSVFDDGPVDLEVIIVDDGSSDGSDEIAGDLAGRFTNVKLIRHDRNRGKGAALRTGFEAVRGDYVAIHDADLEYDPQDLLRLLVPMLDGAADVVYGSRFLTGAAHRVLYFWHSLGNRYLTLFSNMFTDLNLSDMETCYKVFSREVLEKIELEEDRFGFEAEITAKVAALRPRIDEVGISYYGRTYEEGKKIGAKDGVRALYCIVKYNGHHAPLGAQFLVYALVATFSAIIGLSVFALLRGSQVGLTGSAGCAFAIAALSNYALFDQVLVRGGNRGRIRMELAAYALVVLLAWLLDLLATLSLVQLGLPEIGSKVVAIAMGMILIFAGRRWLVFPEAGLGPWKRQIE